VIPAYNASRDNASALDAVFRRDFSNIEVIVVNDGSDDTEALEEALAPFRARTATARYVAFLDADDLWLPDFLRRQLWFLDAHPECGLVYQGGVS